MPIRWLRRHRLRSYSIYPDEIGSRSKNPAEAGFLIVRSVDKLEMTD